MTTEAKWQQNLRLIGRMLIQTGEDAARAVRNAATVNAGLMANDLKRLTPRSEDSAGPHVADAWAVRDVKGRFRGTSLALEVHNADPRFNRTIELQSGGATNLGLILEYGSAPHEIRARNAPHLAFFWKRVGAWVYPKKVEHPGTRPYGMMAAATEATLGRSDDLLAKAGRAISRRRGRPA